MFYGINFVSKNLHSLCYALLSFKSEIMLKASQVLREQYLKILNRVFIQQWFQQENYSATILLHQTLDNWIRENQVRESRERKQMHRGEMVFCFKNCSDLPTEKFIRVIKFQPRIFKILYITRTIYLVEGLNIF